MKTLNIPANLLELRAFDVAELYKSNIRGATYEERLQCFNQILKPYLVEVARSMRFDDKKLIEPFIKKEKIRLDKYPQKQKRIQEIEADMSKLSIPDYPLVHESSEDLRNKLNKEIRAIYGSQRDRYFKACDLMKLSESYLEQLQKMAKTGTINANLFNIMVFYATHVQKTEQEFLYENIPSLSIAEKEALTEMEIAHMQKIAKLTDSIKLLVTRAKLEGAKSNDGHSHGGGGGTKKKDSDKDEEKAKHATKKEKKAIAIKIGSDGRQAN